MKKIIKINFHSSTSEEFHKGITAMLAKKYDVEISDDYDYYFVNEIVFYHSDNMRELLHSHKRGCICILICGEAIYPDLNLFDYVVGESYSRIIAPDRVFYSPYLSEMEGILFHSISEFDNVKKNISPRQILNEKTKFCNFIYSNANAHKMRDDLFYAISKYKQVDSLGKHLKNVNIMDTRQDEEWGKISIRLKSPYKFSIAAENACFAGYTSEKLVTSMMANTIPIYWGNPYVGELYNPKSFINVADYRSLGELVEYIEEVDQNDDLWCDIMSQPWRTQAQIEQLNDDVEKFYRSFYGIFEKDVKDARRRLENSKWNEHYVSFLKKDKRIL